MRCRRSWAGAAQTLAPFFSDPAKCLLRLVHGLCQPCTAYSGRCQRREVCFGGRGGRSATSCLCRGGLAVAAGGAHLSPKQSEAVLERRALPCREQGREPRAEGLARLRARSTATEPEVRAPLFHGPRVLSASAAKYMITLRESEETEPVGSKRKSAREVRRCPPLLRVIVIGPLPCPWRPAPTSRPWHCPGCSQLARVQPQARARAACSTRAVACRPSSAEALHSDALCVQAARPIELPAAAG